MTDLRMLQVSTHERHRRHMDGTTYHRRMVQDPNSNFLTTIDGREGWTVGVSTGQAKPKGQGFPKLEHIASTSRSSPRLVVMIMARGRPRGFSLAKGEKPRNVLATTSNFMEGTTSRGLDHGSWSPS
uniref:Uncharacterized protein n=1 Tax=Solanum tuberosum TaxID=4113 RepID=M1DJ02_SOLTU